MGPCFISGCVKVLAGTGLGKGFVLGGRVKVRRCWWRLGRRWAAGGVSRLPWDSLGAGVDGKWRLDGGNEGG